MSPHPWSAAPEPGQSSESLQGCCITWLKEHVLPRSSSVCLLTQEGSLACPAEPELLQCTHLFFSVLCSLNVNRYPPANYDQVHLHPHLFPEQPRVSPSSYSPSGGVGFPPAQQALKVPQLDQYPSFPQNAHQQQQHYTASALQQALLSPTPPDYSRHQQVPHILQGLLSPRHSLTGHTDMRLPQAEFAQLIKRRQQQQQQQEFQELFRHMSQGDAGNMGTSMGQNLSERQSLSLPYQSADTYHPQNSPQHLLKIRAQECIQQVPTSVPPHGYVHQPALFHSESMEEDCTCEGARDSFPDSKSSNTLTKGCHETPLLVNAGGHGDPESLLGTANHAQELGTHQYRHQPAAGFSRNKVPSRGKASCCLHGQNALPCWLHATCLPAGGHCLYPAWQGFRDIFCIAQNYLDSFWLWGP